MTQQDRSFPYPLGVSVRDGGANVAVYSSTADLIEVCVFDDDGNGDPHPADPTAPATSSTAWCRTCQVGTRYALRVHGAWNPEAGLRHNVNKLLLDPHATAVSGEYTWGQAVFAHDMNNPEVMDESDAAGSTPLCVVTAGDFDWGDDRPTR